MIEKLRKLLLDEKYQTPSAAQATAQRRGAATPQPDKPSSSMLWGGGVVVTVAALLISVIFNTSNSATTGVATDPSTLCPLDEQHVVSETYIHIDLSEKLTGEQHGWLLKLLDVAKNNDLQPYSLFSISQMQTTPTAPRVQVQQFCIPDINGIDSAGKRVNKEDCQEIAEDEFDWEQNRTRHIGAELRNKIENACKEYVDLKARVEEAAERYKSVNLEQNRSYIVGSIEDAMYASNPNIPSRLIVFSDMLQNAKWYSQYNTHSDEWTANNLKKLRKSEAAIKEMGGKPPPANIRFSEVLLCYLPSAHSVLAPSRNEKAHRNMWKKYFESKMIRNGKFQDTRASGCAEAAKVLMQG